MMGQGAVSPFCIAVITTSTGVSMSSISVRTSRVLADCGLEVIRGVEGRDIYD